MGHTSDFFLAFIDELENQTIIIKMFKWANKKQNNFNIYNVAFFLKKQRKTVSYQTRKHLVESLALPKIGDGQIFQV